MNVELRYVLQRTAREEQPPEPVRGSSFIKEVCDVGKGSRSKTECSQHCERLCWLHR
jgi:hypothetical protein